MDPTTRLLAAALACLCAAFATSATAQPRPTLDQIRERGHVICGVDDASPGLAAVDAGGAWRGLDVDVCRAVAIAALGDAAKVQFRPLMANERYQVLRQGEVDLLARAGLWSMALESELQLRIAGVSYFDGEGVIVRRDLAIASVLELSGAKVCLQSGSAAEVGVVRFWAGRGMPVEIVGMERAEDALKAYDAGRCTAYVATLSGLEAERQKLSAPDDHVMLPEVIAKDPLGPVVRQGDEQWLSIVRWSLFALIHAEEVGITSQNIDAWIAAGSPVAREFAGAETGPESGLGIDPRWAYLIVKAVGNYGEVFERNLGKDSPLGLRRGLNSLWNRGGLIYAPSMR